jgi:chromosome segregation ATPase
LSETIQLEQLLNEKASMEDEGRELEEESRQLKVRAKMLTEKIIEELRKKNDAKQKSVNTLQFKVNELESELNMLSDAYATAGTETTAEPTAERVEMADSFEKQPQETPETPDDSVSVTEVVQEEDLPAESKEKKRKFF